MSTEEGTWDEPWVLYGSQFDNKLYSNFFKRIKEAVLGGAGEGREGDLTPCQKSDQLAR